MKTQRKGMTPKNEKMNETFFSLSQDAQMKLLGITKDVLNTSRFKNMSIEDVIYQLWHGKFNSVKRNLLKTIAQ